ncbi:MAG: hypothetical protein Fur0037_26160 [Planctomycetota bacterium]
MPRLALAALILASCLAAQIPEGHLVFAARTGTASFAALQLVDPASGVVTPLHQPGASLALGGARTVAYDPAAPTVLYSSNALSISIASTVTVLTLTGNEFVRTTLPVNLGAPGLPYRLRWATGFGLLLMGRGGQLNRMYLRDLGGNVRAQPNLLPAGASDLAFWNGKAYATCDGGASGNGSLVEWDLAANTERVLGSSYPRFESLAVLAGQLLAGDDAGTVWMIDPATGNHAPFLGGVRGAVQSLAVSPLGAIYLLARSGQDSSIYSMTDLANPIYTTSAAVLEDLEIGVFPAATVLTFGDGCPGAGNRIPAIVQGSMPSLGGTFSPSLRDAAPNTLAVLAFGNSRLRDALGPLPRSLAGIGMPGCTQYTGVLAAFPATTSNFGDAAIPFALPANPLLIGVKLPMQWAVFDPSANLLGVATSNGGEVFPH